MTLSEARDLVAELAAAALGPSAERRTAGHRKLAAIDGRTWLLLDDTARSFSYAAAAPVTGRQGWLKADLTEPTGFVAVVTSFHTDGHIRQRATRALARRVGVVPTAALAVRLLDHVHQVREEAQHALLPALRLDDAGVALGVLLAGQDRQHASSALRLVRDVLVERSPLAELVETLMRDADLAVRRWAFAEAHDHEVLTPERMLAAVRSDPDQRLRATAATWLVPVANPPQLRELVTARSAEARLVAVTYVPDAVLTDDDLLAMLTDRAARVRAQARWRAQRRGIDAADHYRSQLVDRGLPTHVLAASLDGLAATGSVEDLQAFTDHLQHPSAAVRTAAVTGVSLLAPREQALERLGPVLLDPSPRVSSTAAWALLHLGAPPASAEAAWASPQAWTRRAAWRMCRGSGGWNRVEADLRAATDPDPQVATLGQAGVRNWLSTSAATTWARLSDTQRERIQTLLAARAVGDATTRAVAFHARIHLWPSRDAR